MKVGESHEAKSVHRTGVCQTVEIQWMVHRLAAAHLSETPRDPRGVHFISHAAHNSTFTLLLYSQHCKAFIEVTTSSFNLKTQQLRARQHYLSFQYTEKVRCNVLCKRVEYCCKHYNGSNYMHSILAMTPQ